jgi:Domain of unknown function (DUF4407)
MKRVSDFMAWLGGGDKELLAQVPQERARFTQMAGVLLTTAGIAVLSMTFALRDGVKVPLAAAIVLGLLWGVVILNLDRFLVLSMGFTRDRARLLWLALPRFALAALLAIVISTPLVLRVFASDINDQLAIMHNDQSRQLAALEHGSGEQQEADSLQQQITADQKILDGQLPGQVTSPQLQTAQAQVSQLQPTAQNAQQAESRARLAWQCELYGRGGGCAGASSLAGNGPLAQAKYAEYVQARDTYDALASQLTAAQNAVSAAGNAINQQQGAALARYQAQARKNLPGLQAQYAALEARIAGIKNSDQAADDNNTGLLAQLSALSAASSQNLGLQLARLTVLALFFIIEILPVSVKFLLNMGEPTAYEIAAQLQEDQIADSARIRRAESRQLEQRQSEARINAAETRISIETDMRNREAELGKRANAHVASHVQEILDAALLEWADQARSRLPRAGGPAPDASVSGNGSSPPPKAKAGPASDQKGRVLAGLTRYLIMGAIVNVIYRHRGRGGS